MRVVLVQLPIPPSGHDPIVGNVPLAAGYLKRMAKRRRLTDRVDVHIFPPQLANELGDQAIVGAITEESPDVVGFTCYLWNIERTLWIAEQLKRLSPGILILLGGPEITWDNSWVLQHPAVDFAAIGEGEQTFVDLIEAIVSGNRLPSNTSGSRESFGLSCEIPGLFQAARHRGPLGISGAPAPRRPMSSLDEISSPYLDGILDAADERMLLLETIRGCVFKCKFCYYPKSYDSLYFLSREKIIANLEHARERGAREVVLLDPTLNQRRDFDQFVELLAHQNPDRQFTYFGELRAEGINARTAQLLRLANFSEVEIGLQSLDSHTQDLMDRKNNQRAFERGVRSLMDEGIRVTIDLIIGLPGDTVDSIRRGLEYLSDQKLFDRMQVFHLAILPGTAFRHEATQLGLRFQPKPPYYVLETPTLDFATMYELMAEAQDALGIEFDPLPPARTEFAVRDECRRLLRFDFDEQPRVVLADLHAEQWSQVMTLWFSASNLSTYEATLLAVTQHVLETNPFTTLEVVLDSKSDVPLSSVLVDRLERVLFSRPTYLDMFYSVQPGTRRAAKRIVVLESRMAAREPDAGPKCRHID